MGGSACPREEVWETAFEGLGKVDCGGHPKSRGMVEGSRTQGPWEGCVGTGAAPLSSHYAPPLPSARVSGALAP